MALSKGLEQVLNNVSTRAFALRVCWLNSNILDLFDSRGLLVTPDNLKQRG
jgi:hypothetical protein